MVVGGEGMAWSSAGIYYLIDLPLSYYEGFVLPHRFGLSNQDLKGWISDQIKSMVDHGRDGWL